MRIISSFKDYYDFPQKWGFDPKIVYVRETKLIHKENVRKHFCVTNVGLSVGIDNPTRIFVGFAGKIHEYYVYENKRKKYYFTGEDSKKVVEEARKWAYETTKQKEPKQQRHKWLPSKWQINNRLKEKEETLKNLEFLFEQAPVWLATGPNWQELNPCFRRYDFESFKEGNQMYQELSQYMSNVWSISQPEIPIPSDKDMVSIKGFDKFSFRKDKAK